MKRKLLFCISAVVAVLSGYSQVSLPNGNFESWTSVTNDYPEFYPQNSNMQSFAHGNAFNLTKTLDAYHGSYGVQLMTNGTVSDPGMGYMGNFTNADGNPADWTGGAPITEKPTGIRGYYKYNVASGDSAVIAVVARQGGVSVGTYMFKLGGVHTTYTLFDFAFSPALSVTPDSIIFATASSDFTVSDGVPGSTLLLDSLSFDGISTQPAQFNGDFELWQTQVMQLPDSWIIDNDQFQGVTQTSDAVAGNYAVELETYLGDHNGVPRANAAQIGTGYWDNSCSCEKGGLPFTNQVDTLAFYYKYIPADPNDSAFVYANFKSGGSIFSSMGIFLHASASYQYMEMPFNLPGTPDSVMVSMQSSAWGDSALSFVGSVLKVDEMHFKSQSLTTGILHFNTSGDVSFYPNPFTTTATIVIGQDVNTTGMEITICDALGRVVKKTQTSEHRISIDRAGMKDGIYFYELKNKDGLIKNGKMIIE